MVLKCHEKNVGCLESKLDCFLTHCPQKHSNATHDSNLNRKRKSEDTLIEIRSLQDPKCVDI